MTQLITILSSTHISSKYKTVQFNINQVLAKNNLQFKQISKNCYSFVKKLGVNFCQQQQNNKIQYLIKGSITIKNSHFQLYAQFYDQNNVRIASRTQYHKTMMTKYTSGINQSLNYFQIKTNPLNGQIKMVCSLILPDTKSALEIINNIIFQFEFETQKAITKIQAVLETEKSGYKNHLVAPMLLNTVESCTNNGKTGKKLTQNQESHEKYFNYARLQGYMSCEDYLKIFPTNYYKNYIKSQINRIVLDKSIVRKSNLSYLEASQKLQQFLEGKKLGKQICIPWKSTYISGKKQISLDLIITKTNANYVNDEYRICQKLSKKGYCTFLKSYVLIDNKKHFNTLILTHLQPSIPLQQFIQHNKMCLNFQDKINFATQVIGIIWWYELYAPSNMPTLKNNLMICQNKVKIDKLYLKTNESIKQMAQIIYQLFFGNNFMTIRSKKLLTQKRQYCSTPIQQCKYHGPNEFCCWIKKILIDILSKQKIQKEFNTEKMLFLFGKMRDIQSQIQNQETFKNPQSIYPSYWFGEVL